MIKKFQLKIERMRVRNGLLIRATERFLEDYRSSIFPSPDINRACSRLKGVLEALDETQKNQD